MTPEIKRLQALGWRNLKDIGGKWYGLRVIPHGYIFGADLLGVLKETSFSDLGDALATLAAVKE